MAASRKEWRPSLQGSGTLILVTVGTQLPFDRLVRVVDNWARQSGERDILGQIGATTYKPDCFEATPFMAPAALQSRVSQASLIVSHAGMGSVIAALTMSKPIIIMPRKKGLGEHRNDHQVATARNLETRVGIHVAWDETQLAKLLDAREHLQSSPPLGPYAPSDFTTALKTFFTTAR